METLLQDNPFVASADAYDGWFDRHHDLFQQQIAFIRPFLTQGSGLILEVGCGSGQFSVALGIPYGIDLSLPLCKKAYQRGIGIIRGDGELLPIQTEAVSQVFLITVLEFVHDPDNVLYEVHRVLLRGGSLIVVSLDSEHEPGAYHQKEHTSSTFLSKAHFFSQSDLICRIKKAGYQIRGIRRAAGLLLVSSSKSPDRCS
ncbi:MAG: class I SAM-dependent methyltransferase [Methanospirillum sp.]|uniref:class I SAM-dependent methyltransferase n=1 Tax=Methanospirillum sp. TaxID=45200 RepID=UPI00236AB43C|nr:class I SAM-dependent methyltransferase [Methanospirillum sp.]MDD1728329.1 class I SAM-dependent methyltransferase [Methanospirillum sp.]